MKENVTIIQRKRVLDGKTGQVILFSDDLDLSWENMILYYRLRFQIEFTFRDVKQFWGIEDFMKIKKKSTKCYQYIDVYGQCITKYDS